MAGPASWLSGGVRRRASICGALDAALMAAVAGAAALLFSDADNSALGWGGAMCVGAWIGRAAWLFAAGQTVLPVRFGGLGEHALWRAADAGIMVMWGAFLTLHWLLLVLAATYFVIHGTLEPVGLDPRLLAPFGVMCAGMLRVGAPLASVGAGSLLAWRRRVE